MSIMTILVYALLLMTPDEYHLARAIDGERPNLVCPNLDKPECKSLADRVGQVALNRKKAGWCSSIETCVNKGFWGAKDISVPRQWAVESAKRVLDRDTLTDDFFVFSRADRDKLGLSTEEANFSAWREGWGLYFYSNNALQQ